MTNAAVALFGVLAAQCARFNYDLIYDNANRGSAGASDGTDPSGAGQGTTSSTNGANGGAPGGGSSSAEGGGGSSNGGSVGQSAGGGGEGSSADTGGPGSGGVGGNGTDPSAGQGGTNSGAAPGLAGNGAGGDGGSSTASQGGGNANGGSAGALGTAGSSPSGGSAGALGTAGSGGAISSSDCAGGGNELFCSEFEDPAFADWDGASESVEATLQHTTTTPFAGLGSLEASNISSGGGFAYLSKELPPVSSGQLFARAYYRLPSDAIVDEFDILYLGDSTGQAGVSITLFASFFGVRITPSTDALNSGLIVTDSWFCLELRINISDTAGEVELSRDGTSLLTLSDVDTLPGNAFSNVRVGMPRIFDPQAPISVLIDNLVVSPEPIGCN